MGPIDKARQFGQMCPAWSYHSWTPTAGGEYKHAQPSGRRALAGSIHIPSRRAWHTCTPTAGKITDEYRDALRAHALTAFMAVDASRPPGSLQELMLHETAVAWVRRGLTWTLPARPWGETGEAVGARLLEVARKVNDEHSVAGLCGELPIRVESLYHAEGGKLQK